MQESSIFVDREGEFHILFYFQLLCSKIGCHLYFSSHFQRDIFLFIFIFISLVRIRLRVVVCHFWTVQIFRASNGCFIWATYIAVCLCLDWKLALWLTVQSREQLKYDEKSNVCTRNERWCLVSVFIYISLFHFGYHFSFSLALARFFAK